MITFLLGGRRYDISFISKGGDILKDFADKIRAQGSLAAVIRANQGLAGKKLHPKDWKKFINQAKKLSNNAVAVMQNTTMVKTWTVTDSGENITVAELRPGQIRVMFFEDEHGEHDKPHLILTHGFLKKEDDTPTSEIDRFLNHRRRYYTWLFRDS